MSEPTRRTPLMSRGAWFFVAVVALTLPLTFGIWPTSFGRVFAYLFLAWVAAFVAGGAVMVLQGQTKPAAPPEAPAEKAPDAPGAAKDGTSPPQ